MLGVFFMSWMACFQSMLKDLFYCISELNIWYCISARWTFEDYFKHWLHRIASVIMDVLGPLPVIELLLLILVCTLVFAYTRKTKTQ